MKRERVPRTAIGTYIEERTERLRGAGATIYSVTNDRGFVPSLEMFDKQVFSADTGSYKKVGHLDIAFNPSRINVGSVAMLDDEAGGAVSPMYTVVRCGAGLRPAYLLNYLRSEVGLAEIKRRCEGAVRFMLKYNDLCRIEIPIPSLAEQDRLVALLDEADALRKLRAQAEARTAQLIPAIFQEMFGSPSRNEMDWPVRRVCELFPTEGVGLKCGPFGSALKKHEYVPYGIPVWGIPNVLPNKFVDGATLSITPAKYSELKAYKVEVGDMLISRAGTVGRVCVAETSADNSIIGTNLIRFRVDRAKANPWFFSTLLTHFPTEVGRLSADSSEGAYSFMSTSVLSGLRIPIPPVELQDEFAVRVSEVRALQAVQSKARAKVEALWGSLLGEVFG